MKSIRHQMSFVDTSGRCRHMLCKQLLLKVAKLEIMCMLKRFPKFHS